MKVKNINSSSRKTELQIRKAFAELMKEKLELKYITVTELVNRASITRAAFYTHYDSVYDLANEIQEETLDFLLEGTDELKSINDLYTYFDKVIIHLKENENFYSMLLASNEPLRFTDKITNMLKDRLTRFFSSKKEINSELAVSFFADGCISLVLKHFRGDSNISLDDINNFMKVMFKKVFE